MSTAGTDYKLRPLDKTKFRPIDPSESTDQRLSNGSMPFLGIDTEMLVRKNKTTIWPHTVGLPQERDPYKTLTSGGNVNFDWHADGMAFELCIAPDHCLDNIMSLKLAPAFSFLKQMYGNIVLAPVAYSVPKAVMEAAPENVKRLGCLPSNNVYGDAGDPKSLGATKRTTGCHLHISAKGAGKEDVALNIIKWADVVVGTTWTYISPVRPALEVFRRKAYGRAGEYRLKQYPVYGKGGSAPAEYEYGVEYRVLSGSVMQNPVYLTLMLSLYRSALRLAQDNGTPPEELSIAAKDAINISDKRIAASVLEALPFTPISRSLIQSLAKNPVKVLTAEEWVNQCRDHMGHKAYAVERGVIPPKTDSWGFAHTFHFSARRTADNTRHIVPRRNVRAITG